MARKLKTYITSAGFFDLAVAAPSMKAALEAWGSSRNLFHHGFARLSEDPGIVAATMAKPGVVLRRPVGSDAAFGEQAELPRNLPVGDDRRPRAKPSRPKAGRATAKPADEKAARAAAAAFERAQRRREQRERREEAEAERLRQRRDEAIAAAQAALTKAEKAHDRKVRDLETARAALENKLEAEERRWKKERDELDAALRKARSGYLRLVR